MADDRGRLRDGLIGGVIAGLAVAAFFLAVDLSLAEPLRTPRFLAASLFGVGQYAVGPGTIAAFTSVHLAVFAAIGAAASVLFRLLEVPLNPLTGAVYGVFVCTLLFYGSLITTGVSVLGAPSWPAVLAGNLFGGVVLAAYLRWRGPEPGVTGLSRLLEEGAVFREGIVSGLIGAAVVAVWFLILDGIFRQPMYTPAALGALLFNGVTSAEAVRVVPELVWGYTVVHVAAFLAFGMVVSALVDQVERVPSFLFGVVLLGVVFEVFFVGLVASVGTWVLQEFAWWSVLGGNLLAGVGMGVYLWDRHPTLRKKLTDGDLWREEEPATPPTAGGAGETR